jgi:hypothetical protein
MEKLLNDLKRMIQFKDTTVPGDIVLIVADNPQLLIYALVTGIEKDERKNEEWWKVTMQMLAVPPQEITWILRTPQMTGMEVFTMNGEKRFVKAVHFRDEQKPRMEPKAMHRKKTALIRVK